MNVHLPQAVSSVGSTFSVTVVIAVAGLVVAVASTFGFEVGVVVELPRGVGVAVVAVGEGVTAGASSLFEHAPMVASNITADATPTHLVTPMGLWHH